MKGDPFTLRVALDKDGGARGEVYLDYGEGYAHRDGEVVWRQFEASSKGKGKGKEKAVSVKEEDEVIEIPDDDVVTPTQGTCSLVSNLRSSLS